MRAMADPRVHRFERGQGLARELHSAAKQVPELSRDHLGRLTAGRALAFEIGFDARCRLSPISFLIINAIQAIHLLPELEC